MALSSFDLALLVDDNSFKFTCVAYVEDTLFAGTIDGNLCVYKQEQSVVCSTLAHSFLPFCFRGFINLCL